MGPVGLGVVTIRKHMAHDWFIYVGFSNSNICNEKHDPDFHHSYLSKAHGHIFVIPDAHQETYVSR